LKTIAGIYPPHEGVIEIAGLVTPMIELGAGFDIELSGRQNIYLNGAIWVSPRNPCGSVKKRLPGIFRIG